MLTLSREILHLDMDTFFVSVERLCNSRLNNKPVMIGGTSDRGVVACCSYETRRFGVHAGMPMKMAKQLCPESVIIRGDMDLYSKYSDMVTGIIAEKAPVYEKMSVDEHYIDLTGMDRFFGALRWSHELRQNILKNTGLPLSFGLSTNKTVAKIATGEAKPNGEKFVEKYEVGNFLHPLSIRKIPGIGEKNFRLLRTMGLATIGQLSSMPRELMQKVMGKNGLEVWEKANGIDLRPVKPYWEQKSIGTERTFEQDSTDIKHMHEILRCMVEKLAWELRCQQKLTACVTVKIRYANFDTHTLQQRISYTSFDHELAAVASSLFGRLYTRRMLIRLIGVKFSHLVSGVQQLDLFDPDPRLARLYQAMDRVRGRFGQKSIRTAAAMR